MRMIGLSDRQLEIITCEAETMAERTCQDFLDRVAAILQQAHNQIDDDDVSFAVRHALRELIHNSDVWKDWKQNALPMRESGERFTAPVAGPNSVLKPRRPWCWLQALTTRLLPSPTVSAL